jgi:hypothetical protein
MLSNLSEWLNADVSLTFSQLANVQTVGIGLYLALAVIQAVSTTGIAGLARRVSTMRAAILGARMSAELMNIRRLSGEVSGLEIQFHDLNRRLLIVASALFLGSVCYFAYCTVWQSSNALRSELWFIIFYYLALPILIFCGWAARIWRRCRSVAKKVDETEKRVQATLLGI